MKEQNEFTIEKNKQGGRPKILDEKKRQQIIALVANGSSRRVAARIVGCAHVTITKTAQRDPQFAADLRAADHNIEVEALRRIRAAAKKDRHWKAAAWLLERTNPYDFRPRTPDSLSQEDVCNMLMRLAAPLIYKMSDEETDEFQDRVYDMARVLYESNELAKYLPIPPLPQPNDLSRNDPPKDQTGPKGQPESQCPLAWECPDYQSAGRDRFTCLRIDACPYDAIPEKDCETNPLADENASKSFVSDEKNVTLEGLLPRGLNEDDPPGDEPSPQVIGPKTLATMTPTAIQT